MYRNGEGYPDPVAGAAMATLMKEYRQNQRRVYRKHSEIKARPKVYIVSKYAGDVEQNTAAAIRYACYAIEKKRIPVVSHLLYPQILDDNDPEQRELGLLFGQALLALCEEVWVFGTKHSSGMQAEIHEARRLQKRIRFYNERMEEIHEDDR
jgi:hypothetical protein